MRKEVLSMTAEVCFERAIQFDSGELRKSILVYSCLCSFLCGDTYYTRKRKKWLPDSQVLPSLLFVAACRQTSILKNLHLHCYIMQSQD
ncbi:hypothetical protein MKW98_015567 [Papaver atlanticum]|uniref:Uncharacterized protein n=1 Tax=Papaver atlanticum TaxID=357466 RepID=A0AAD4S4Q8_9MAGN|nr:hypothetical protein MKW98_015567 [Papaver atlanticum]